MKGLLQTTALALAPAALVTAALSGVVLAADNDQVTVADCDMNQTLQAKVKEAAQEAAAAAAKSGKYIHDEKDKAESDKNSQHEILADYQRTSFSMDVPEVTVGSENVPIPTIHVTMQTTSFNVPVPGQCKVGSTKIPEFHGWTVRWVERDILRPCMTSKQVKANVPQFTAGTTTIQVPKITVEMKTREFSWHLPQLTERTPENEMRKHENNISQEEEHLKQTLAALERKYEKEAIEDVTAVWQKARDRAVQELDAGEKKALAGFAAMRVDLAAKIAAGQQAMRAAGTPADAVKELVRQGDLGNKAIDAAETNLKRTFAEKKKAMEERFDTLRQKYLGDKTSANATVCAG